MSVEINERKKVAVCEAFDLGSLRKVCHVDCLCFLMTMVQMRRNKTTSKQGKLIAVFNSLKSRVLKLFLTDKKSVEQ